MAPLLTTIAKMVPSKNRYQLTARATRIWEVSPQQNDDPISIDMVLLDKEGDHIHSTIPKKEVKYYKHSLHEGKIYKLQHFEVANNTRSYRPVTSPNLIKCNSFTSIMEAEDQGQIIPKHKFEFLPLDKLEERSNKYDYLIDVVGRLTLIEGKRIVTTRAGPTQIRHIYIQDERKQPVRVTLWGKTADLINETCVGDNDEPVVVVITSTRVVYYEGTNQIQSTQGTKLYLNLDIPEAKKIIESGGERVQVKLISNNNEGEEPLFKTIPELLEMDLPSEKEQFTCQGTITDIRTDIEWKYVSCPTCRKGLQADNTCIECKQVIEYPVQRYRIMTTISDDVSKAKLVIFDKEAEKVIRKPLNKLLDLYEKEDGKGKVFDILQQCVGEQYTFKVRVGTSRFGDERELKCQKVILALNKSVEEGEKTPVGDKGTQEGTKEGTKMVQDGHVGNSTTKITINTPEKGEKRTSSKGFNHQEVAPELEGSTHKKRAKVTKKT